MAIGLRAVEPQDIDFIESIENKQAFWKVSETQLPFSRYQIKQYIENAHIDIYSAKQYRFIIYIKSINVSVGIIDFYDFNPKYCLFFLLLLNICFLFHFYFFFFAT